MSDEATVDKIKEFFKGAFDAKAVRIVKSALLDADTRFTVKKSGYYVIMELDDGEVIAIEISSVNFAEKVDK